MCVKSRSVTFNQFVTKKRYLMKFLKENCKSVNIPYRLVFLTLLIINL